MNHQVGDHAAVDIIIVNWNSGDWLRNALTSIEAFGGETIRTTIVIDNGSQDGSASAADGLPKVKLVLTGENLGFGRACNLGARDAMAPYLLFLNPDAALIEGGLQTAVAYMESEEARGVAVCGIRMIDANGNVHRDCGRFPLARSFIGYSFGIAKIFPRLFPQVKMNDFDHLEDRRVDHVIGAFYLVRRSVFEAVGGFDERFFVYYEDLDLSRKIADFGWSIQYLAGASAFHKGAGTSDQIKARRLLYDVRSRIIYCFKHFGKAEAICVALSALIVEPVALAGRAVLRGSARQTLDTLKGFAMLWKNIPNIIGAVRHNAHRVQPEQL